MVATAKHQQQTMDINYGLFYSFRNISDKNREEYRDDVACERQTFLLAHGR